MKQILRIRFSGLVCLGLTGSLLGVTGCGLTGEGTTTFTVRIENVSAEGTLDPSDGSEQDVPLSPGVWVVHDQPAPLFTEGEPDRGEGLEALAEDGDPSPVSIFSSYATVLADREDVESSGLFTTPSGGTNPAPIGPGEAYEFQITAGPGASLSFATMFVPSNDCFLAPDEEGIPLFDERNMARSGDVTGEVALWDAGTEVNEEPGVGPNQVQRQEGPDTGDDEGGVVAPVDDGFTYPEVADVLMITITPEESALAPETIAEGVLNATLEELVSGWVSGTLNIASY